MDIESVPFIFISGLRQFPLRRGHPHFRFGCSPFVDLAPSFSFPQIGAEGDWLIRDWLLRAWFLSLSVYICASAEGSSSEEAKLEEGLEAHKKKLLLLPLSIWWRTSGLASAFMIKSRTPDANQAPTSYPPPDFRRSVPELYEWGKSFSPVSLRTSTFYRVSSTIWAALRFLQSRRLLHLEIISYCKKGLSWQLTSIHSTHPWLPARRYRGTPFSKVYIEIEYGYQLLFGNGTSNKKKKPKSLLWASYYVPYSRYLPANGVAAEDIVVLYFIDWSRRRGERRNCVMCDRGKVSSE